MPVAKHLGMRRLDIAFVLIPGVIPRRRRAAAVQGASHCYARMTGGGPSVEGRNIPAFNIFCSPENQPC
jgi:hypothetical protein